MLEINGLKKKYFAKVVLNDLSLSIKKNNIYGLVGPNGTGKSSFFKILVGLVQKTSGDIYFQGEELSRKGRDKIAYMPPEDYFYNWMTIKNVISFFEDFYPDFNKNKALELLSKMELDLKQKVSHLSTGQKGRLKILLVLSRNVDLYLIDEPLNGLEQISRDMVIEMIGIEKKEDKTFIISTHLIDELDKIMDRIIMFREGKVYIDEECKKVCEDKNMTLNEFYKTIY